jgi:hypothetical protein
VTARQRLDKKNAVRIEAREQRKELREKAKVVKHAAGDIEIGTWTCVVDDMGFIIDLGIPVDEVKQAEEFVDNWLEHAGVKGMRWGVRKETKTSAKSTGNQNGTKYSKPVQKLSDTELSRRVKRLETEKRYKELTAPQVSRGKKIVMDSLIQIGQGIIVPTAIKYGTQALDKQLAKKISKVVKK